MDKKAVVDHYLFIHIVYFCILMFNELNKLKQWQF
ncbi:hypothetical protein CLV33_11629 [Jejuia pallidilutea]|uniref:Uncharacterized protein n=1 Tax=Jejuia pallidilutea TaxID=504487 RepID=A0A362WWZ5_9FLAO|nr:hypothetical protein CLV33_11629 [Jejuia pallidilutea]